MQRRALAAAVLSGLAALACSKDSGGPSVSFEGVWQGTTAQGKPLGFYVEPEGIRIAALDFTIVGTSCTTNPLVVLTRESPDIPFPVNVSDSSLVVTSSGSGGTINVNGGFESGTTASGSLAVTSTGCNGSATTAWTVTRTTTPSVNLTGTWQGTFASTVVTTTGITLVLSQSGAAVTGTFATDNGGSGTVSGTVAGRMGTFTLTQTTAGCTGSFHGHLAWHESPEFVVFGFSGSDCQGAARGGGDADRVP